MQYTQLIPEWHNVMMCLCSYTCSMELRSFRLRRINHFETITNAMYTRTHIVCQLQRIDLSDHHIHIDSVPLYVCVCVAQIIDVVCASCCSSCRPAIDVEIDGRNRCSCSAVVSGPPMRSPLLPAGVVATEAHSSNVCHVLVCTCPHDCHHRWWEYQQNSSLCERTLRNAHSVRHAHYNSLLLLAKCVGVFLCLYMFFGANTLCCSSSGNMHPAHKFAMPKVAPARRRRKYPGSLPIISYRSAAAQPTTLSNGTGECEHTMSLSSCNFTVDARLRVRNVSVDKLWGVHSVRAIRMHDYKYSTMCLFSLRRQSCVKLTRRVKVDSVGKSHSGTHRMT